MGSSSKRDRGRTENREKVMESCEEFGLVSSFAAFHLWP